MDRTKHVTKSSSKRRKRKYVAHSTNTATVQPQKHKPIPNVPSEQQQQHFTTTTSTTGNSSQLKNFGVDVSSRPQCDNNKSSVGVKIHRLPLLFPTNMIRPKQGFLRNIPPYQQSFQCALETSYEGFVVDLDVVPDETNLQATLQSANMESFFVTDMTQPFGLGTACSPTYVTRCLMGDSGTTYKYLGLRMFAHPWNAPIQELKEWLSARVTHQHLPQLYRHRQSTATISDDGNTSTIATTLYEPENSTKPCFDICLINRMTMNKKLKTEPLDEDHKTTVSWHADSSLEHYSTIAVYQTIVTNTTQDQGHGTTLSDNRTVVQPNPSTTWNERSSNSDTSGQENEWSIGLRVSPNVEGPKINYCRTDGDAASADIEAATTPPIAVSLPTNSAYYLLDDFNHHHQHTVLVNKNKPSSSVSPSTRYSLTFRLLRESHNVNDMIQRCQRCIAQFHKKGTKTYRFEQLTLNELESEWIRQFYIQGQHHYTILRDEWNDYMIKLWDYWNQLETRTLQTIQLLRYAAEGRCFNRDNGQSNFTSKVTDDNLGENQGNLNSNSEIKLDRKLRAKRKKAMSSLLELLKRESATVEMASNGDNNNTSIYEMFATTLDERAMMRELWLSREADPIFKKMSQQFRPIPFPARFQHVDNSDSETVPETSTDPVEKPHNSADVEQQPPQGLSPMPGKCAELQNLAIAIRAWGRAFQSCDANDLPTVHSLDKLLLTTAMQIATKACLVKSIPETTADNEELLSSSTSISNSNLVPLDWDGWKTYDFGLEMQYPWSRTLLDGRKSIEIRQYNLPSSLVGRKIYIIETPAGKDGVSGIVDNHFQIDASSNECHKDKCCDGSTSKREPRILGWSIFSTVKQYKSQQDFCCDEKRHLVSINSKYGWQSGCTSILFGWVVSEYELCSHDESIFCSGFRRHRSLFQMVPSKEILKVHSRSDSNVVAADKGKKKAMKERASQHSTRTSINNSPSVPFRKKRRF